MEEEEEEEKDMDDDDEPLQADTEPSPILEGCYASSLSQAKRKAVDDAFEQLFGYKFGTSFRPKRKFRRKNHPDDKQLEILEAIFGPTGAAQILLSSSSQIRPIERLPLPATQMETITEVKHYAGQSIVVQRKLAVTSDKSAVASTTAANKSNSGLDTLLQELDGPSKLSTVAKTSADWDQFKTSEGLEEDLTKQAQGKNAFLQKKDFLQRVDARRFEVEKKVRDTERNTRGK